jgi:hypothetical protein
MYLGIENGNLLSITLAKAPLVEIIAELQPPQFMIPARNSADTHIFLMGLWRRHVVNLWMPR